MTALEVRPGRTGPVALCSDGLAGTWPDWLPLADALPHVRLVAVLRNGEGLGEAAAELVTALNGVSGPEGAVGSNGRVSRAVLIGHSMGGFVVEAAARLWPDRVSGIVLLDGSVTPAGPVVSALDRVGGWLLDRTVAQTPGLARLAGRVKRTFEPREVRDDLERRVLVDQLGARPDQWAVIARELVAYQTWAEDLEAFRVDHPLPGVPIHVVTAHQGLLHGWVRRQREYADLLRADPGAPEVHHHVIRSGHLVQLAAPDEIAALIGGLWAGVS